MAQGTDVRYRLSAEGVADVVAAFRKVASESKKSGTAASGSFGSLGASLGNLRSMIGGVVAALGVMRMVSIIKEASDAAEKIDLLATTFGESVENLSAFDVALRRMGTSLGEQGRSFSAFLQKTGEASKGIGTAADDFRALGMTTKEIRNFASQDLAARFETVSRALVRMPEGAKRSEAVIQALGVRYAQLIPIMEEVGKRGMIALRNDADKLGALLRGDVVRAAAAAGDAFDDLHTISQALAIHFTAGMAPGMVRGMHAISGEATSAADAFRELGKKVGDVFGWFIKLTSLLGGDQETRKLAERSEKLGKAAWVAIASGQVGLGNQLLRERDEVFDQLEKADARRKQRIKDRWDNPPPLSAPVFGPMLDDFEDGVRRKKEATEAASRDRLAISNAETAATLAIAKARIKLLDDQEQRYYERGLSTLEQHYENRRAIINRSYDAELAALVRNRADALREDNEGKRLAAVKKIDGEIEKLAIERSATMLDINAKESAAIEALANEQIELDAKVAAALGDQHQRRLIEIGQEVEAVRRSLLQAGAGAEEADRRAASYRGVLEQQEALSERTTEAEAALSDLSRNREAVQREIDAGLLSEVVGNERILQLNKERLDLLRLIAADLTRAAEETGTDADRQRAADFSDEVDRVSKAVEGSQGSFERFKARGIDATRQAMEDFFSSGINSAMTFESVMRTMVMAVVSSLQRLAAQLLATRIAMALFGAVAGGAAAGGSAAGGSGGTPVQATDLYVGAGGGLVSGPGTGTSDSIPARLSSGEFVVRAASVSQPWVREFLEALNASRSVRPVQHSGIHRFSEGGLAVPQGIASAAARMEGTVTVGLEDGLIARGIESSEGERAFLRILTKHRRSIGRILG